MKIKLISLEKDSFIGYRNVKYEDIHTIYNNSAFEIYIDANVIKSIPNENFKDFIKHCCSKIRHSGCIIINGPDINNIALSYINRNITEKDLSDTISNSQGFYNCKIVSDTLIANGIKIDLMSIANNHFSVRGIRE